MLRASGHEVWWDSDIPVIADWWATILKHIVWCDVFVFVTSEKSVQSAYCLAELKYASERQRPILPFILEDTSKYTLPPELPHRNQWLIYNGDPAQMLAQINGAYSNIDWNLYKDINAHRPPEPMTGGKSLAQQFQEARRLADEMKFEEAKQVLRNIKTLDYDEWGTDCDEWLERLTSYPPIVDLVTYESTLERARRAWQVHVREYGDKFDPYHIKERLITERPQKRPFPFIPVGVGIVALVVVIIALALLSRSGENTPDAHTNQTREDLTVEPTITSEPAVMSAGTTGVNDATATVNVEAANLRSGPGTNYNRVGSVARGTTLPIVARTTDSEWYLIERGVDERAWISAVTVDVTASSSAIEVVATVPATPVAPTQSQTVGGSGTISLSSLPTTVSGAVSEAQSAFYTLSNNSDSRTISLTMSSNGTDAKCAVHFLGESLIVPEANRQGFGQSATSTVTRRVTVPNGNHVIQVSFLNYSSVCPATLSYTLTVSP